MKIPELDSLVLGGLGCLMDQPENPSQTPEVQQAVTSAPSEQLSGVPRVMGILHIIYSVLGGIYALIGFGSSVLLNVASSEISKDAERKGYDASGFAEAMYEMVTISMIQSALTFLFAGLLLLAGIKLLKYQESGRKLSNVWAIFQIVVAFILGVISISAQSNLQEELVMISDHSVPSDLGPIVGIVESIVLVIYPIVSLILLNTKKARAALE